MNSIHNLDIFQSVMYNEDIVKQEYNSYSSYNATYNNSDEIIIEIPNHDVFTLPCISH